MAKKSSTKPKSKAKRLRKSSKCLNVIKKAKSASETNNAVCNSTNGETGNTISSSTRYALRKRKNDFNSDIAGRANDSSARPIKCLRKRKNDDNSNFAEIKRDQSPGPGKCQLRERKAVLKESVASDSKAHEQKSPVKEWKAEINQKKCVFKGVVAVDDICIEKGHTNVHVYEDEDGIFDCLLNLTCLYKNNNKFYKMQLLRDDFVNRYYMFFRWGRIGLKGQCSFTYYDDIKKAKVDFMNKFNEKTCNDWTQRFKLKKHAGKYAYIPIQYMKKAPVTSPTQEVESKLEKSIQILMMNITDQKIMEKFLLEYDASKAPFGALSTKQINSGFAALRRIERLVMDENFGTALRSAVDNYYTKIPHVFGMRMPPLIKTEEQLTSEIELLTALRHITYTVSRLHRLRKTQENVSLIDKTYEAMNCKVLPLLETDPTYKIIHDYLQSSAGPTHILFNMRLMNIYSIEKKDEIERFRSDLGNRMLLWHGSPISNCFGILSKSLRITPPEVPLTGNMFGKGIYFTDVSSKAANYCRPQVGTRGYLLLAEVALGDYREVSASNSKANLLDDGKISTKGNGYIYPDVEGHKKLDDVLIPCGKLIIKKNKDTSLIYNEYVVYDVNQVRLRFLVEVVFMFA